MPTTQNRLLEAALSYTRRGMPVTPASGMVRRSGLRTWLSPGQRWQCACGTEPCISPGDHPLPETQRSSPLRTLADIEAAWTGPTPPNVMIGPSPTVDLWYTARDRSPGNAISGAERPTNLAASHAPAERAVAHGNRFIVRPGPSDQGAQQRSEPTGLRCHRAGTTVASTVGKGPLAVVAAISSYAVARSLAGAVSAGHCRGSATPVGSAR